MDVARLLTWAAERHPTRRAVGGARPMTYQAWDARTNRLANTLAELGVRPGDRVVLVLAGGEPLASLHLAVQKLGAVSVPLSTRFGAGELAHCIVDCASRLVVTDATTSDLVDRAAAGGAVADGAPRRLHVGGLDDLPPGAVALDRLVDTRSDRPPPVRPSTTDLSVLLYTSGTTGRPKGVPRSHAAEHAATVAHVIQTRQRAGEVVLGAMPLFHTMGLRTLLASIVVGGTWVPQTRFDPDECLDLIARERISSLYLVPTMYWSLTQTDRLSEARTVCRIATAGAAMHPTLADRLAAELRLDHFVNHLGSTEIYTFTVAPEVRVKPGGAGRAGVFSRIRLVVAEQGASVDDQVPPGTHGHLLVSMDSPEAFGGYRNRPEADRRALRSGWYATGDLAYRDDDGDLWYVGRVDDMINSGGENIYPDDIEADLARCAAVAEVVVVGTPDDRWGQAVTAFVVPKPGADPAATLCEVRRFSTESSSLPRMKRPKRVVVVSRIPKSAVGKILRRELSAGTVPALADSAVER